ncbi:transmembrane transport [Ascochyta rabiei]|uniref:Transmembrane transport n=1 Tax=Didymella rabiei TaxID=5454 RepID=A0A163B8C5_DIDRA|nr:transmembrane transport [Ascochyta rabiei]
MAPSSTSQHPVGNTITTDAHPASTGQGAQTNAPVSMVQLDSEKGNTAYPDDLKDFPDEVPDYDAQRGVQKIEATTLAWSKWSLAALLINIWLIFLTSGPRGSILAGLTPS